MTRQVLVPAAALVLFALAWEFLVWVNDWPDYKMASPSDLGPAFWKFRGLFLEHGWETLWRTVAGLLLSVAAGLVLGMVMGLSRVMREALYPLLVGFNAIPKATVVPVIALIFVGAHDMNTVLIAFLISFFPIAVSISIGPVDAGTGIPGHPALAGRQPLHDLLEDRPSQDPARVLRRAEGGGDPSPSSGPT